MTSRIGKDVADEPLGAERDNLRRRVLDVVDHHVEVELLRIRRVRPLRWPAL